MRPEENFCILTEENFCNFLEDNFCIFLEENFYIFLEENNCIICRPTQLDTPLLVVDLQPSKDNGICTC